MMINQMLQIKYPIFQGAMANIATARFAADVSNSGAIRYFRNRCNECGTGCRKY